MGATALCRKTLATERFPLSSGTSGRARLRFAPGLHVYQASPHSGTNLDSGHGSHALENLRATAAAGLNQKGQLQPAKQHTRTHPAKLLMSLDSPPLISS